MALDVVVCPIWREVDIYIAIRRGRDMARVLGFHQIDQTRIEIVILELTRNLLAHAGGGSLRLEALERDGQPGMAVYADDNGPGIPDIDLALVDGYSTSSTLGAGLPGVKRLMDEFAINSTVGEGTHVRAIKWVPQQRGRYR
jgi:anti-sigma regulatory factor (Ser/Thr protein kinase)